MYSIQVNRVQILQNYVIKILVKIQSSQTPILAKGLLEIHGESI